MTSPLAEILVVIPARGGSKGIPMKNIKELDGKPLIQYSIELAMILFEKEHIVVSTDHPAIQQIAQGCGLETPKLRDAQLAQDTTSSYEVLIDLIKQKKKEGYHYKRLLLLQPTSPFRTIAHLKEVLALDSEAIDMVVSVKETKANPYFNLFEEDTEGYLNLSKAKSISGRQYTPKVYEYNGAFYLMKVSSLEKNKISEFKYIKKYVMETYESLDLDTQLDWDFAELILKKKKD